MKKTSQIEDIVLDVEPIAKPRMTRSDKWKKRPCVSRYWDFCDQLRTESDKFGYVPVNPLSLIFILPMPSSWSKKKRDQKNGQPHEQRPDLDNLIKAFKDALLKEDSGIYEYGNMKKIWGHVGAIVIQGGVCE
jgi:hypothetical protein